MRDDIPQVEVKSRGELRAWLEANHLSHGPIWLVVYKKHTGVTYLPWGDIVKEVLCFGWIDSTSGRVDENRSKVYLSPRKPKSPWSGINKRHITELMAQGLIAPEGLRKINAAKADGSWTLLDDVEALIIPKDLQAAFDAAPGAQANYEAFPPSARRATLWWIKSAKTQKTRDRRIQSVVDKSAQNIRPR